MTALLLGEPRLYAVPGGDGKERCAACRVRFPLAEMELVPTRPTLVRCRDEDGCRKRYTPRRLARSVKGGEA